MVIWNKTGLLLSIFLLIFIYLFHSFGHHLLWKIIYKLDDIKDEGSSSVVKDILGEEPYMTIKMKCFYTDNKLYGDTWKKLFADTKCHEKLFNKCFRNRTVVGRHETHVLTFSRYENIKRCVCTDLYGWCNSECSYNPSIRCCLDRGKLSVLCRG